MSTDYTTYRFHGGLHLHDHKSESLGSGIHTAPLAEQLVLRVSQHIGEPNTPLVKVGDWVKKGQMLAVSKEFVSAPVHAPCSGTITAIEPRPIAHPSGQSDLCFILQPYSQDEDGEAQSPTAADLDSKELLSIIRDAGIVGLGGAVFPTAAKLETAIQHPIKTLIINGAECEPYITCDDVLMQSHPQQILRGVQILQRILQPEQTLIGIEDNKADAIKAMNEALTGLPLEHTRVVSIPTLYPSGGEKQLIRILTGAEVRSGQLSFEIGYFAQNVGTCAAIAEAVDQGHPLTSRVITVTGPGVKTPGNWRVALGTPVAHLIELAGGYRISDPRLIMGGPMMGQPLQSDQVPVVKATNTILVLDNKDQPQEAECVRCGQCAEACPAQLLPQQLYWNSRARQFDLAEEYHLFDCIECGCCAIVCPSHIPLVQYYRFAKSEIWEQRRNAYKSERSRKRHEFREMRIQRQKQLDEERRRQKREALAKKKQAEAAAKATTTGTDDKAADAVQAALERVKARKSQHKVAPKNTSNLTPAQQKQIDEADARRKKQSGDPS